MVLATEPLVTIVLAFRNGKKNLPAALNSILWQSYQNWELILINDGSTDGAEQLAKSINDVRIRFYSHAISQGLPACLNQGIALAKGFYIARMDADDIAFPQRLAQQVAFLQSHPEIDLLATSALLIDKNNQAVGILKLWRDASGNLQPSLAWFCNAPSYLDGANQLVSTTPL